MTGVLRRYQDDVGRERDCVGWGQDDVGRERDCVGWGQDDVGRDSSFILSLSKDAGPPLE